jgi:hypothetical protein
MQLSIKVINFKGLPTRNEMKKIMWEQANNISHSLDLKKYNALTLSWDKWLDDSRWAGNVNKSFEHINFEITDENKVEVDIEDDALFVDKRAFYLGAIFICEKTNGKISEDNVSWNTPKEFSLKVSNFIKCSFKEAVEISYKEAILLN